MQAHLIHETISKIKIVNQIQSKLLIVKDNNSTKDKEIFKR